MSLRVSRSDIKVYFMATVDEGEEEEETEPSQLSPVFTKDGEISNEEFELSFLVTIPALGLMTYYIRELKSDDGPNDEMTVAKVKIFNSRSQPFQVSTSYCSPSRFLRIVSTSVSAYFQYIHQILHYSGCAI